MSSSTPVINGALIYILAISTLLLYLIAFIMIYFVVRYRKSRHPEPIEVKDSKILEAIWIIIPTLLVLSMFFYGLTGFQFLRKVPEDAIVVKVHSKQWSWLFEYPNGKKSGDMVVPIGKNIKCELTSDDVIHGFYVPEYRIQIDTVPGMPTYTWFNANTFGSYYILCTQYCGLKHSNMIAKLIVVAEDQYEKWLKGEKIEMSGDQQFANLPAGEQLLFERGCVSCHTVNGSTSVGPTLKGLFGSKVQVTSGGDVHEVTVDEAYIKESIKNPTTDVVDGFPNTMPSGKDALSDQEIDEIINYLKTLK